MIFKYKYHQKYYLINKNIKFNNLLKFSKLNFYALFDQIVIIKYLNLK